MMYRLYHNGAYVNLGGLVQPEAVIRQYLQAQGITDADAIMTGDHEIHGYTVQHW